MTISELMEKMERIEKLRKFVEENAASRSEMTGDDQEEFDDAYNSLERLENIEVNKG